jgi:hypothetical protein
VRPRAIAALLPLVLAAAPAQAQIRGQAWEVTADSARVTVGDTVTLRFRLRVDERDLLFDTIPIPVSSRSGVARVLSVGRLVRDPNRIFLGEAKVAFYRPGHQPAPNFSVTFMRAVKGIQHGVILSDTAWVDIMPVLPPGDHPLQDIRPIESLPSPRWPWLVLPAAAMLALWIGRRRRHRAPVAAADPAVPAESAPDARRTALGRLRAIEAAQWPSQGEVARHYEEVANVVRDFLAESEHIQARELTTRELFRTLARHHLADPVLERGQRLLAEADLVKFAAARPGMEAAREFLAGARAVLEQWPPRRNGVADAPR